MNYDLLRFCCAFLVGSFMLVSGLLSQTVTQNQLSSPSTLGFDGVIAVIILGCHLVITYSGITFGLEFFSLIVFLILWGGLWFWSQFKLNKNFDYELYLNDTIIIGVCFNLFVGGLFSLFYFFFLARGLEFPSQLWFGNFKFVMVENLLILLAVSAITMWYLIVNIKKLSVINFGSDFAWNMGINPLPVFRESLLMAFFLSGVAYCFFGVFSFLSLLFPILVRSLPVFRGNLRRQIFLGAILCGLILAILDMLVFHFTFYGAEIPVGIMSSFLGPLVIMLIIAARNKLQILAKRSKKH